MAKTKTKLWWKLLDADSIRQAFDEATVDAYGDHEQHTGLLTAIGDELSFPFEAKVMGQTFEVVTIAWPESDSFGLDLICKSNDGERHPVAARHVEPLKPLPEGHFLLAAYLDWKSRF